MTGATITGSANTGSAIGRLVIGRLVIASLAAGALISIPGCSPDTTYPSQPISLICPWSAGGGTDRVSRQVASQLERELGIPVNVINATGGSGVTGHTRGALARPDGYTLTMITVELNMLHWRGLTTVNRRDFAPLRMLNQDSAALFVRDDSPIENLDDLQATIAHAPRELKASGTAFGGIWHVALAGWLDSRGLGSNAAIWISINGAGPSTQELIAGGVDLICCSLPEVDALLASGRIRSLGVMSESRIDGFPDVPTFREQEHDWVMAGWRGLAAPRDTPPDRLQVLNRALDNVTADEEFVAFMRNAGFDRSIRGPDEFEEILAEQDQRFRAILNGEAFSRISDEHFGVFVFPTTIGVLLLGVAAIVFREVRHDTRHQPIREPDVSPPPDARPPLYVLAACLFYLVASEPLGFVITATVTLVGLFLGFRVRPTAAVTIGILGSLLTYQIFAGFLRVPLPRGPWGW